MSDCMGSNTVTTRVDQPMVDWIEQNANELGVTPAEYLRRVLDFHRKMENGELECPECENILTPILRENAGSNRGVA